MAVQDLQVMQTWSCAPCRPIAITHNAETSFVCGRKVKTVILRVTVDVV